MVLNNANIYTGITTVTAGILQITNNDALGSATAGTGTSYTTVTNLASLELNGATAITVPEDIRINGLGVGSINGALRQISTAAATTLIGGLTSTTSATGPARFRFTQTSTGCQAITDDLTINPYNVKIKLEIK